MTTLFDPHRLVSLDETGANGVLDLTPYADGVRAAAWREGLTTTRTGERRPYPVLPSLTRLTTAGEQHLVRTVPHVVGAWHKVVLAHRTDQAVRDFLAVPTVLREWVDRAPIADHRVDFCRFDLVGSRVPGVRVVEFNANCPGGVIFSGAFADLWRAIAPVAGLLDEWHAARAPIEDRHWFTTFFGAVAPSLDRGVAVFHRPGGNVLELDRMVALFAEAGVRARLADPAEENWLVDDVRAGYLKYGVQAVLADVERWESFLDRLVSGKLRIMNPLPGRWIGDNKLCLAVLSDPRFARLFTPTELAAVQALIPVSRKIGDGVTPAELRSDRPGWVIKGPYDTQGASVYVGVDHDDAGWSRIVDTATDRGWLAQEAVPPAERTWAGRPVYQDLSVVLARGRWAGYTSRISEHRRVNVAQGGGRQLVFGCADVRWPDPLGLPGLPSPDGPS